VLPGKGCRCGCVRLAMWCGCSILFVRYGQRAGAGLPGSMEYTPDFRKRTTLTRVVLALPALDAEQPGRQDRLEPGDNNGLDQFMMLRRPVQERGKTANH